MTVTHTPSAPIPGSPRDKAQRAVARQFDEVMRGGDSRPDYEPVKLSMSRVLGQAWGECMRLTIGAVRSSHTAKAVLRVLALITIVLAPMAIVALVMPTWMCLEANGIHTKWEARKRRKATSPERSKRKGLTISIRWA